MEQETETVHVHPMGRQKTVVMAVAVVILSMSVAISGWIVISMYNEIQGDDPFTTDKTYALVGTMLIDGGSVSCTGNMTSEFSSDTDLYFVFTYTADYGTPGDMREVVLRVMFESDKTPSDLYEDLGVAAGLHQWKGEYNGISFIISVDDSSIVRSMAFSYNEDRLEATIVE
jgi:hypothetical protein